MTELAIYEPSATVVALPDRTGHPGTRDFDSWVAVAADVIKLSNVIYDTPFVPDGLRGSSPAVAAAILAGREMGLGPMTSLQHIHVIKGKPGQSALLMRALVQSRGHKWEDGDVSDVRAVVRGCRKGESTWLEVTYTAAQAKTAGIDLGRYPQDKLYARATSRLARRKFADVVMGMPYSAEELEDGDLGDDTDHTPETPVAEKPAQRTAQRRQGRTTSPQTPAAPEAASQRTEGAAGTEAGPESPAVPNQPPLPGEDEPEPQPEQQPRRNGKVGIIQAHFRRLGFTDDEREQRLAATAAIAGIPEGQMLTSSAQLDDKQLSAVADTLSRCRDRGALIALLAAGDKPDE
jgi:hypothetical protein